MAQLAFHLAIPGNAPGSAGGPSPTSQPAQRSNSFTGQGSSPYGGPQMQRTSSFGGAPGSAPSLRPFATPFTPGGGTPRSDFDAAGQPGGALAPHGFGEQQAQYAVHNGMFLAPGHMARQLSHSPMSAPAFGSMPMPNTSPQRSLTPLGLHADAVPFAPGQANGSVSPSGYFIPGASIRGSFAYPDAGIIPVSPNGSSLSHPTAGAQANGLHIGSVTLAAPVFKGPGFPSPVNDPEHSPFGFISRADAPVRGGGLARRGRGGPPVHTPLKTSGHNSTPSVQLNPAAFAAMLSAGTASSGTPSTAAAPGKPKRKNIVAVPLECSEADAAKLDEIKELQAECEADEEGNDAATEENKREVKGAGETQSSAVAARAERRARLTALQAISRTRSLWVRRIPLAFKLMPEPPHLPSDSMASCEIYPEPWPFKELGLPDTIDIYLPGQPAWLEYIEIRREEIAAERENQEESGPSHANDVVGGEDFGDPDDDDAAWDETQPVEAGDKTMVFFKMQKFLQSQADGLSGPEHHDPNAPLPEEVKDPATQGLFRRISGVLPPRLRDAALTQISKRGGGGSGAHSHTMSLGLPSSGGPFGPAVLSALGLKAGSDKAASDAGDDAPALGPRPSIARGKSVGDVASPSQVTPAWKLLSQGFGYDIDEEEEGEEGEEHTEAAAGAEDSVQIKQLDGHDESLAIDDDLRTNPSEDADTSDMDENEEDVEDGEGKRSYDSVRKHNTRLSAFGTLPQDVELYPDYSHKDLDEQFSNPSDEDAARQDRLQQPQVNGIEGHAKRRRRAFTSGTLPSSSIGEGEGSPEDGEAAHRKDVEDVISNPSDEDNLEYGTFGESDDQKSRVQPANVTLSSASGPSCDPTNLMASLDPSIQACAFSVSGQSAVQTASSNLTQAAAGPSSGHFRLPSIRHSSFGGSAFGGSERNTERKSLSAKAPAFTPGAFTFQAPGGAPKLPPMPTTAPPFAPAKDPRGDHGREKRQRFSGVRGPLDDFADTPAQDVPHTAPEPDTGFGPNAPIFIPTWGHANGATVAQLLNGPPVDATAPYIQSKVPPSFLSQPVSKPISIRRPDDTHDVTTTQNAGASECPRIPAFGSAANSASPSFDFTFCAGHKPTGPKSGLSSIFGESETMAVAEPELCANDAHKKAHHPRDASISLSDINGDANKTPKADDEEELQDIIEELGQRLDQSLEVWAGRILQQVQNSSSASGPAPPFLAEPSAAPATVTLPQTERDALLSEVDARVSGTLDTLFARMKDLISATRSPTMSSSEVNLANDSQMTLKVTEEGKGRGHGPLDALGEFDFDYVQDILDSKITGLQKDVEGVIRSCFFENASKEAADASAAKAPEMSAEAIGRLADTLGFRVRSALDNVQAVLLSAVHEPPPELLKAVEESEKRIRNELSDFVPARQALDELVNELPSQMNNLSTALHEAKTAIADQVEMSLVNAITPHLESLRQEALDPDVLAARITSNLIPLLDGQRSDVPEKLAEAVVEYIRPHLQASQTPASADTASTLADVQQLIGQELREHALNLDPVVALIEPLLSKQEDVKMLSNQVLTRQGEMENTLSVLPSTINAKTEVFLSAAQQAQEVQRTILERLKEISEQNDVSQVRISSLKEERSALRSKLDDAQTQAADYRNEATQARVELDGTNNYVSTLKDEVTRLESRLEEGEKAAVEASEQITDLRSRHRDALEAQHTAERRADEALHRVNSIESALTNAQSSNTAIHQRLDQALEQIRFDREERQREREASAQATAELLARLERAQSVAEEAQRRADAFAKQSAAADHQAKEDAASSLERAAKAEGEISGLEKRIADQDAKIANLQQLTATQKQKAAQSQQKLSEAEKKGKELEALAQEFAVAQARLADMESRLVDQDVLSNKLRVAQEVEMELREKVSASQASFFEFERELINMKETLVERDELDAVQAELATSREEIARLKGQLAERENAAMVAAATARANGPLTNCGNASTVAMKCGLDSGAVGTWASMHAPRMAMSPSGEEVAYYPGPGTMSQYGGANGSYGSEADYSSSQHQQPYAYQRQNKQQHQAHSTTQAPPVRMSQTVSLTSTVALKQVEQDDGGWWS
ncbi:hypothetical protein K437DRAFT_292974 [Tilletiaria anomala UBC 951]|uniref:Uncharacterized protein n=1 Tax=Tilletiaria anomala (strain ATCC 24038 / CBS 436.72 / UBC 951) TaxID=1037660 RepID=A0A066WNE7_TILAU|nr:uncharacterized protein K437DRAFT_292974 [Tilletiaria anomala UBC 951]KDN52524.1 hypothetical protein K437DRAFT_292974 [Tilletiaria anomala UBC 951]